MADDDDIIKDAASLADWDITAEGDQRPAPDIMCGHTLGHVDDAEGFRVFVGTYNGTVTVGDKFPYRFTQEQAEEFAQLFVRACWEAAAQGGAP